MVEEMMLLANVTVAEHVLSRFAGCTLLRRHEVPPPRQFEPLLKAASAAGFSIDISSSKVCATGSPVTCLVTLWRTMEVYDTLKRCGCQGRAAPDILAGMQLSCGECVLMTSHRAHLLSLVMKHLCVVLHGGPSQATPEGPRVDTCRLWHSLLTWQSAQTTRTSTSWCASWRRAA